MDHREEALRRLAALAGREDEPLVQVAVAAVHALLHLSDTVKHGLRDLVYELRD